ncbi:hypothetical protein [Streptomyces microflavus]|uniref:hypothetical protein n=1 Tax=Streptomyces microflavus TaxID=1919 RepID=UPI0033B19F0C
MNKATYAQSYGHWLGFAVEGDRDDRAPRYRGCGEEGEPGSAGSPSCSLCACREADTDSFQSSHSHCAPNRIRVYEPFSAFISPAFRVTRDSSLERQASSEGLRASLDRRILGKGKAVEAEQVRSAGRRR